jgi:hypothetical protein
VAWDPAQYLKFAGERLRPALDLLARVAAEAPETVVDLGCGAGTLAPLLLARWPGADKKRPRKARGLRCQTGTGSSWVCGRRSGFGSGFAFGGGDSINRFSRSASSLARRRVSSSIRSSHHSSHMVRLLSAHRPRPPSPSFNAFRACYAPREAGSSALRKKRLLRRLHQASTVTSSEL